MKKIIALLLSVLMLAGMLAGCKKDGAADGNATSTDPNGVTETQAAGSLVVTANASVLIKYGTDGLVLSVEGINNEGIDLVESYEDLMGSSCAEVVENIIKDSSARSYFGRLTYVVVKQNKDSGAPGTNFMEGIEAAAKNALDEVSSEARLVMIPKENLDANGYIDLKTAKMLVESYLEIEALDNFDGTATPVNDYYSFAVSYDGMEDEFNVNAVTGGVGQGALDGALQDPEEFEEETDPKEDATENTEPAPTVDEEPVGEPANPAA